MVWEKLGRGVWCVRVRVCVKGEKRDNDKVNVVKYRRLVKCDIEV